MYAGAPHVDLDRDSSRLRGVTMAWSKFDIGCCCGDGCLICVDNFDRSDNTNIGTGAPSGCGWTQGGDQAFEIDTNVMTHPDGSESTAVVGSIPAEFWAKVTFSGPGTNDGDAVGICIGDSGHRFVIESIVGDSLGYDVFGLRVVGIEFGEVWMPFSEAPTSQDITLCVKRDSGYDYTVQVSTASDDLLCGAFLGQATGHDGGSVGVYAKGAATIKDFQISEVTGEIDCVTCSEQCDAEFDVTFADTPVRDYLSVGNSLDPTTTVSVTGGSLRATDTDGTVAAGFAVRTCKPDFTAISSCTYELTIGSTSPSFSATVTGSWWITVRLRSASGVLRDEVFFRVLWDGAAWELRAEHRSPIHSEVVNTTTGSVSTGDTIGIEISNATGDDDTWRIEFHKNGVEVGALTMTGQELGDANTGTEEYIEVIGTLGIDTGGGGTAWIEADRFRMFYM